MNGRLYDPLVGRFLSPDNEIQNPASTQNYNRYTYCLNNPLKYVDLTGENQRNWMNGDDSGGGGGGNDRFWERNYQFRDSGGKTYTPPNNGGGDNGGGGDGSSAGHGENGNGANGVYYDYSSGSYRSTITGIDVGFSTAYNAISPYFDNELAWSLQPYAWASAGGNPLEPKAYRLEQTPGSGQNNSGGFGIQGNVNTLVPTLGWAGVAVDATRTLLTNTKTGSDLAYNIAYISPLAKGVNYLKPISYGLTGFAFVGDIYLSNTIDPSTGKSFQSWGETGANTIVSAAALTIGSGYGVLIQLDYMAAKAYLTTSREHPEWVLTYPRSYYH